MSQLAARAPTQLRVDHTRRLIRGVVDVVTGVALGHVRGELGHVDVQVVLVRHRHLDPRDLGAKGEEVSIRL